MISHGLLLLQRPLGHESSEITNHAAGMGSVVFQRVRIGLVAGSYASVVGCVLGLCGEIRWISEGVWSARQTLQLYDHDSNEMFS